MYKNYFKRPTTTRVCMDVISCTFTHIHSAFLNVFKNIVHLINTRKKGTYRTAKCTFYVHQVQIFLMQTRIAFSI